jgi:2',3'-cyclic-nucleotide 2'-phosphodiesterase/3'-nucleotidase
MALRLKLLMQDIVTISRIVLACLTGSLMRPALPLSTCPPVAGCAAAARRDHAAGAQATLALLETTDLHANVLSYDYYKLQADPSIGLERTATLIKQARAEFPNNLLLDNGDAMQGTALADYQALVAPVACGQPLAIYKAMNQLGWTAAASATTNSTTDWPT